MSGVSGPSHRRVKCLRLETQCVSGVSGIRQGFGREADGLGVPRRTSHAISGQSCNFRSKVISIVRRGGAGELLFRSTVIAQLSGEGVRVNCFSGQRSKSGGKMLDCFDAELYHEGTF